MICCWILVSVQHVFDDSSLTGFQMHWCIALDDHWNKPNLISLASLYFSISSQLLSVLNLCWPLTFTISAVWWMFHHFPLCWSTEGLPLLSAQRHSPLISGVALSCSLVTMHETFSHVRIRLILNVQQYGFFLCWKWLYECSQVSETRLWCWGPW